MTKLKILAKLLQDKHITVEEFELLAQTEKEYIYTGCNCNQYIPYYKPYYPYDTGIICGTITSTSNTITKAEKAIMELNQTKYNNE